jgi:polysaccharide deacetylase 2 family uncharacterized protein YibQ
LILIQGIIILFLVINQKKKPKAVYIQKQAQKAPEKKRPKRIKIAIILDDWGYSLRNIPNLDNINIPLTLSILPNHRYSQAVNRYAQQRGWQTVLHLPLEPLSSNEYSRLEPDTILASMSEKEVLSIIKREIDSLPNIVGVSNHMGSKATTSEYLMRIIFKELKKRNLFFVDSLVTSSSVCKKIARETGLSLANRDIFLDNEPNYEYIASQVDRLINLAKARGKAIGIGHDRRLTLTVLADKLSKIDFEKSEFEFVLVSQLVD